MKIHYYLFCLLMIFGAFKSTGQEILDISNIQFTGVASVGDLNNLIPENRNVTGAGVGILPAITGAFLIGQLENALKDVIDVAADRGFVLGADLTGNVNILISEFRTAAGDITAQLAEMNKTAQELAMKGIVLVDQLKAFITSTISCAMQDINSIIRGLDSFVQNTVHSVIPWSDKTPVISKIYEKLALTPFGIRKGYPATLIIEGFNLKSDERAGHSSVKLSSAAGKLLNCKIIGSSKNMLIVGIDTVKSDPDAFVLELTIPKKKFLGRKIYKVSNVISILPEPVFQVHYKIVPNCVVRPEIHFDAGRYDGTNDECNGPKHYGGVFTLLAGWNYVRHYLTNTSVNGCTKAQDQYLGGNSVKIIWRCPERETDFIWCNGPRKWAKGNVIIVGTRDEVQSGSLVEGTYPGIYGFNNTVNILTLGTESCSVTASYSVQIDITYPDGSLHSIPSVSGTGYLQNSAGDGATMYWDPVSRTLAVRTPYLSCSF